MSCSDDVHETAPHTQVSGVTLETGLVLPRPQGTLCLLRRRTALTCEAPQGAQGPPRMPSTPCRLGHMPLGSTWPWSYQIYNLCPCGMWGLSPRWPCNDQRAPSKQHQPSLWDSGLRVGGHPAGVWHTQGPWACCFLFSGLLFAGKRSQDVAFVFYNH